jgi:putative endonuclease
MVSEWYIYLIRCRDGSLYTGISPDVDRRLAQHLGAEDGGSKYLRHKGPLTMVFQQKVGSRSLALKVENRVKRLSKSRKEALVGMPDLIAEIIRQAAE